jgi:adenylosuccinate synthase
VEEYSMTYGGVCALVGAQFGSEGKGLILSKIAGGYEHHVRVGAANAGHTLYDANEGRHVMQQLPCAAYANPDAELYIGPGALISPHILMKEIDLLQRWRRDKGLKPKPIYIDYRAHVIQDTHVLIEQATKLAERIGSTSTIAREGVGAAQAARVMRSESCVMATDWTWAPGDGVDLIDVPYVLSRVGSILLEGTQGTGLSLTTGFFPYVTSRNTTAAALAADCGIGPNRVRRIIVVARTFPIRVAGTSGPWHRGSREVRWEDLGVDPETERTTVTKKIRRVATWSTPQVQEAVYLNGATELAITFMDYIEPLIKGKTDPISILDDNLANSFLLAVARDVPIPIRMIGTGPNSVIFN